MTTRHNPSAGRVLSGQALAESRRNFAAIRRLVSNGQPVVICNSGDEKNPLDLNSDHPAEANWQSDCLPDILGRLNPPVDWKQETKVPNLVINRKVQLDQKKKPIRNFTFLPRFLCSNLPGKILEAYFHQDSRLRYEDLWARMPSCTPALTQAVKNHRYNNRRIREVRLPYHIPCFTARRATVTRTDVEIATTLSSEAIRQATVWPVTLSGIQDPSNPTRYLPLGFFLEPSTHFDIGSEKTWKAKYLHAVLDMIARVKGALGDYTTLERRHLPRSWNDRLSKSRAVEDSSSESSPSKSTSSESRSLKSNSSESEDEDDSERYKDEDADEDRMRNQDWEDWEDSENSTEDEEEQEGDDLANIAGNSMMTMVPDSSVSPSAGNHPIDRKRKDLHEDVAFEVRKKAAGATSSPRRWPLRSQAPHFNTMRSLVEAPAQVTGRKVSSINAHLMMGCRQAHRDPIHILPSTPHFTQYHNPSTTPHLERTTLSYHNDNGQAVVEGEADSTPSGRHNLILRSRSFPSTAVLPSELFERAARIRQDRISQIRTYGDRRRTQDAGIRRRSQSIQTPTSNQYNRSLGSGSSLGQLASVGPSRGPGSGDGFGTHNHDSHAWGYGYHLDRPAHQTEQARVNNLNSSQLSRSQSSRADGYQTFGPSRERHDLSRSSPEPPSHGIPGLEDTDQDADFFGLMPGSFEYVNDLDPFGG